MPHLTESPGSMSNTAPPTITSPCIAVCKMDDASGYCIGCWRTIDEIIDWQMLTQAQKADVLDQLPERISLRPPAWRERLRTALEDNPWIAQVQTLERNEQQLQFLESVGCELVQGFLLARPDLPVKVDELLSSEVTDITDRIKQSQSPELQPA